MTALNRIWILVGSALLLLAGCKGGRASEPTHSEEDTILMTHASNLMMIRTADYVKAVVRNPWDTTKILQTYILVADSIPLPDNLPEGTVVRTPLKKSLVYSSVHQSLVDELGGAEAIKGICDKQYIHDTKLLNRIKKGEVTDCGPATSPTTEKIIRLNPDAILLSPYENVDSEGTLARLGIPVIECADYMENSPLGRTEWMKFFGILYGKENVADSLFAITEKEYLTLKSRFSGSGLKPKVLMDCLYGQTWHVPRAESTMSQFINDAGGINPFSNNFGYGSIALSGEQVLKQAGDADIWLLRYYQDQDKTMSELGNDSPLYPLFKAYKNGNVWGCNTSRQLFFEEMPFHPQWLLEDLISILHPESGITPTHAYFVTMDENGQR